MGSERQKCNLSTQSRLLKRTTMQKECHDEIKIASAKCAMEPQLCKWHLTPNF